MNISDENFTACATYLIENLRDDAPDYSLSKSLELLREGDPEGATFWANLYIHIMKVEKNRFTMPSVAIH